MGDFDSRNEQILEAIINGTEYTDPPQSRNEAILKSILDKEEYTEEPQSRIEDLLLQLKEMIEQGGGVSGTLIEYLEKNPIANYYINEHNGSAQYYSGWSASDFMEVSGGETIHFAWGHLDGGYQNVYNACYDSNKQFISNKSMINGGYATWTVPSNAKYIRISSLTSTLNNTQAWREISV